MAEDKPTQGTRAAGGAKDRILSLLAGLIMLVAVLVAIVLVLHIVFVVFRANPDNAIVEFVDGLAGTLAWRFESLFLLDRQSLQVLVNFGLAAVVYLVVGTLLSRVIRSLA